MAVDGSCSRADDRWCWRLRPPAASGKIGRWHYLARLPRGRMGGHDLTVRSRTTAKQEHAQRPHGRLLADGHGGEGLGVQRRCLPPLLRAL